MKRLILLIAGLVLASCDSSSMQADGTSSETQTSLTLLASRIHGAGTGGSPSESAPVAARGTTAGDSSTWDDVWASWSTVAYTKVLGRPRSFEARSTTNTFLSATSFLDIRKFLEVDAFTRFEIRAWQTSEACPDSAPPPPYCRHIAPGTRQMYWRRVLFRNGLVMTLADSVVDSLNTCVFDERWALQPNGRLDGGYNWWNIYEKGVHIGYARQLGQESWRLWTENSSLNSLSTMTIFDLAGKEVPPDPSRVGQRLVFPEDSLGFFLDSIRLDSVGRNLRLGLSWRFDPLRELPDKESADFEISFMDQDHAEGEAFESNWHLRNPIQSPSGSYELVFPLDSVRIAHPERILIMIFSRRDSLVGTRAQTRRDFLALVDTTYPGAEIAP